ncbi:MAG TPA: hypothetical protein PL074_03620, partial [Thermoflexales bacterium]|nr:hypothetical protein [Thermoflexales bacterium]
APDDAKAVAANNKLADVINETTANLTFMISLLNKYPNILCVDGFSKHKTPPGDLAHGASRNSLARDIWYV